LGAVVRFSDARKAVPVGHDWAEVRRGFLTAPPRYADDPLADGGGLVSLAGLSMRHAHLRRAIAVALLGLSTVAAQAQPSSVWPLDPETLPGAIAGIPAGTGWPSPPLGEGPFLVESVRPEHRMLRVAVVARGLEQPWSIAFLPGGDMLVTERPGRLRLITDGKLDPTPVAGIPAVRSRGLQGLMDVVLHPRFADNRWVYFSYHRPVGEDDGETMLARGRWEKGRLVDVRDIFATGAIGTEGSRIGFARDGMLHMTISAPGVGPDVVRSQDPKDYAGKTRLRDDGSIPPDNPFVNDARYPARDHARRIATGIRWS
jgi:glucose/arabinose dehydrogenase